MDAWHGLPGGAMQPKEFCRASKRVVPRVLGRATPGWLPSRRATPRLLPAQHRLLATTTAGTYLAPHVSDAASLAYQLSEFKGIMATAALPVLKVGAIGGVGAFCTKQGWLTPEGRHMLATMVVKVFMPALLLDKLAQNVSIHEAVELWPIALNVIACHGVGAALAWLHTLLLDTPAPARKAILASAIVGNVGNLPLILSASLLANEHMPVPQDMVIRYVMMGWFWANLLQAPIGWFLLHKDKVPAPSEQQELQTAQSQELHGSMAYAANMNEPITPFESYEEAAELTMGLSRMAPVIMTAALWHEDSSFEDSSYNIASNNNNSSKGSGGSGASGIISGMSTLQAPEWLPSITSPCVLAGVLAIVIGSMPSLRDAIFTANGSFSVIGDSLDALSQPAPPCLMLVWGSNLAQGPGALRPADAVGGVVTRLVLLPLVGAALIAAAEGAGLLQGLDPVAKMVMMITWATPTAILVHSVASMHQNGDSEIGGMLFYEHAAALLTLPLAMAFILNGYVAQAGVAPMF